MEQSVVNSSAENASSNLSIVSDKAFLAERAEIHSKMLLILLIVLLCTQIILVYWKTHSYRSYQHWTLMAMALAPMALSVYLKYVRFVFVWSVYFFLTFLVYVRTVRSVVLSPRTPRQVYKWFLMAHVITYAIACTGYILLLFNMFGLNVLFWLKIEKSFEVAIHLLFYGVYFGVLGRDISEMITELMTIKIGFYSKQGLPKRILKDDICALCDNRIVDFSNPTGVSLENSIRVSCGHIFHEFCLRGWNIVGKKDICPYCHEKFDPKKITSNLWERPSLFYAGFLDLIRYSIAWQPLILVFVQFVYWIMKLK